MKKNYIKITLLISIISFFVLNLPSKAMNDNEGSASIPYKRARSAAGEGHKVEVEKTHKNGTQSKLTIHPKKQGICPCCTLF